MLRRMRFVSPRRLVDALRKRAKTFLDRGGGWGCVTLLTASGQQRLCWLTRV